MVFLYCAKINIRDKHTNNIGDHMTDINLNSEIVYQVIEKAKEFHAKEEVVIPENPNEFSEEDFAQILADHQNDLTYQEVKIAIDDLEPDQQITLVAIMYLGRGDFEPHDWDLCLSEAKNGWTKHTASYLLSKPHIADYLEEGLILLGKNSHE